MAALDALQAAGAMSEADHDVLAESYRFCERTRNRLFLVNSAPSDFSAAATRRPRTARGFARHHGSPVARRLPPRHSPGATRVRTTLLRARQPTAGVPRSPGERTAPRRRWRRSRLPGTPATTTDCPGATCANTGSPLGHHGRCGRREPATETASACAGRHFERHLPPTSDALPDHEHTVGLTCSRSAYTTACGPVPPSPRARVDDRPDRHGPQLKCGVLRARRSWRGRRSSVPGSAPTQPARNNRNDARHRRAQVVVRQALSNDVLVDVRGDHVVRRKRSHRVHPRVQRRAGP